MLVDTRRLGTDRPIARVLAVEDAERIALQPRDAVLGQVRFMFFEIVDQRGPPRVAALRIAERVQLERDAVRNAELEQQLMTEAQQLDIGLRLARADDFGVELVELAEAALLRTFVAKCGAVRRHLERREL